MSSAPGQVLADNVTSDARSAYRSACPFRHHHIAPSATIAAITPSIAPIRAAGIGDGLYAPEPS
jgi:hypothetical protein